MKTTVYEYSIVYFAFYLERILQDILVLKTLIMLLIQQARITARILFLLFGPSHELASHGGAHVLWEDVSQLTVANRDQLRHCFQDLGGILRLLEQHQTVGPFENLVFIDQFAYFLMQLFRVLLLIIPFLIHIFFSVEILY